MYQSARMSEIKDVGYTWMAKCNQLTPLPFKGLMQKEDKCMCVGTKVTNNGDTNASDCEI